jgi:hypothetical protein
MQLSRFIVRAQIGLEGVGFHAEGEELFDEFGGGGGGGVILQSNAVVSGTILRYGSGGGRR